jgi:hypothetical protein
VLSGFEIRAKAGKLDSPVDATIDYSQMINKEINCPRNLGNVSNFISLDENKTLNTIRETIEGNKKRQQLLADLQIMDAFDAVQSIADCFLIAP